MTQKSLDQYLKLYQYQKKENEKYQKKKYDVRMSPQDKKIQESKFQYQGNPMGTKHVLIFIIMIVLILFLVGTNYESQSSFTVMCYLGLFTMLLFALKYDVKKKYYIIFMILFVIVFLLTKNFDFFPDLDDLMANNNKGNNKLNNKKIT